MDLHHANLYTMPLIMGPLYRRDNADHHFRRISLYGLQYPADQNAIQKLLPPGVTAARESKVTVMFGYYDGVDFMADGGYREIIIQVAARFDGEHDHVEGDFILAMFLDDALPIIYGREQMGIPKLPAQISPVRIAADGAVRCEASLWGHMLFGIELGPLSEQMAPVRLLAAHEINKRPWLCWKYIPALDGPPDADYPLAVVNELQIDRMAIARSGALKFGQAGSADISVVSTLLDAFRTLTPTGPAQGMHLLGSSVMKGGLSRRLR